MEGGIVVFGRKAKGLAIFEKYISIFDLSSDILEVKLSIRN